MPCAFQLAVRIAGRAFLLAPLCAAAPLASAQTRVDVPEDCGSEAELHAELGRLLGAESAASAVPERLHIRRDEDGQYALLLTLRGERRSLRDPDCRALFKTAVVMAAAVVDPRVQVELERESAQPPAQRDAPSPAAAQTRRSAPAEAPREDTDDDDAADEGDAPGPSAPWRAAAWLGAGAAIALLPQPSPQLELSGTLARGKLGLALAGRYVTPADERAGDAYGVRIHGLGARLSALYDPAPFARLQAGVALDYLSGRGLGSAVQDVSGSGTALALALEAAIVPLRAGQVRLSLGVAGHYALVRPSFEITGYGEVYRTPSLGATLLLRLGWEFP
jgi:hypothetical protein